MITLFIELMQQQPSSYSSGHRKSLLALGLGWTSQNGVGMLKFMFSTVIQFRTNWIKPNWTQTLTESDWTKSNRITPDWIKLNQTESDQTILNWIGSNRIRPNWNESNCIKSVFKLTTITISDNYRILVHPLIEMEPTMPSWWLPRNLVVCGGVSLHLILRK